MKKILLILLIILPTISKADKIPGFLELDLNYQDWTGIGRNTGFANTEIDIKYGATWRMFKPYLLFNTTTFFMTGHEGYNAPFRDIYSAGAGIQFFDVLYVEYIHKCSHTVITNSNDANRLYYSLPGAAHNIVRFGLRFNID